MNSEILRALARHVLTLAGGYFGAQGVISQDNVETAASAVAVLVGLVWSVVHKLKAGPPSPPTLPAGPCALLLLGALLLPACTVVKTRVERAGVWPGQTNEVRETVSSTAYSFLDSAQKIQAAQAKQTKTTQGAGFTGLEQEASSTNLTGALESVAAGFARGLK